MLDIRFIRENADKVAEKSKQKGYEVDISRLLELDQKHREILQKVEKLQHGQNLASKQFSEQKPDEASRNAFASQRRKISQLSDELKGKEEEYSRLLKEIPNVFPDDTPLGGEEANREEKKWGDIKDRDFEVQDHLSWGEQRGMIDFERGAKVAGNKFYYLKGGLVELELAILSYAVGFAKDNGFWPMSVPHLVNTRVLEGAGFSARGAEKQVYKVDDEDLNLIATAEIPLTGYFADEIMPAQWLPSKMVAWSPSYRVEGGAYGKHNRGLFRVHQFNKVEMYVLAKPSQAEEQHQQLLELEEKFCQELGIPYRVVRIAAGDLGAPAYKKYDIEYWSPAEKTYRELMSCSNVTDYQARRLNIRYKNDAGQTELVHTLNATLAATSRLMIAIIENCQDKDAKISIPPVLQPYLHGQTTL